MAEQVQMRVCWSGGVAFRASAEEPLGLEGLQVSVSILKFE